MSIQVINAYLKASTGVLSFQSDITRWWDVNNGMSLSSGEVTSWADQIASVAMSPVNGSAKPDFSSTAINGAPGITCLNTNEALYTNYTLNNTTHTFAIVASFTSASVSYGRIMSLSDPTGATALAGDESKAYFATLVRNSTSSNVSMFRNNTSTGTHAVGYSTPKVFLLEFSASTTSLYINNTLAGSFGSSSFPLIISQIGIFHEIASGGNEDAKGSVGDIMVINRTLTSTERTELQTYWAGKFGV